MARDFIQQEQETIKSEKVLEYSLEGNSQVKHLMEWLSQVEYSCCHFPHDFLGFLLLQLGYC